MSKWAILFNARQMGHYVMVSLWCESFLTNISLYFKMNNIIVKCVWCYIKKKGFQTTSGGIKGGIIMPPSRRLCPHLPPQSEEKNGQNQPFSANFGFLPPQNRILPPRCPPQKKFLVPPLQTTHILCNNVFQDKKRNGCCYEAVFFVCLLLRFLYWTESSPTVIQVRGLQMTINFALVAISVKNISSRHSNLNFAHYFVMYWLLLKHGETRASSGHITLP